MKRITALVLAAATVILFCGCKKTVAYDKESFFAADTLINIYVGKDGGKEDASCKELVGSLEKKFSKTVNGSEVYRFNESDSGISGVSDDTLSLIELSKKLYASSGGSFDITLGPLISLWNITGDGAEVPSSGDIAAALAKRNIDGVIITGDQLAKSDPSIGIDLGGIAKGYICRKCVEYLQTRTSFGMVDIGGNIGVYGQKPNGEKWTIAIKDPEDTRRSIGYLTVDGGYVAVSGDYERYFEKDGLRYHHLLDPETGYPADNGIREVAVYTKDSGELGDGLSSALFVMGTERSLELYKSGEYEFEALFVTADGKIEMTEGMKKLFTPSEE